jgi:phosphopantetheine adenylyltransferase
METLDKKQVALKKLVDELIKDQPSRQLIKQLTTELGMEYSVDPMTQMNTVLQSMNSVYLRTNRRTDLES